MSKLYCVKTVLIAAAAIAASVVPATSAPAASAFMQVGSVTSQPIGHYQYCQLNVDDCNFKSGSATAPEVTDYGWNLVRSVNADVNRRIVPITDQELYGRDEVWTVPTVAGDCEDFVLLKRKMLMEKGFPENALLITVVRKPDGEGHAVLTMRTSKGDYVLDNLDNVIKLWTDTPYSYLKRQATFNSGRWVTIEQNSDVLVGSLR
jgi:predicted transglutaminase-like cysteine proteinase